MYPLGHTIFVCLKTNGVTFEGLEEKIQRLENDKESLLLQVSVTNDQVEAQSEKIHDLEYALRDRHSKMEAVEDLLQHVSTRWRNCSILWFPVS